MADDDRVAAALARAKEPVPFYRHSWATTSVPFYRHSWATTSEDRAVLAEAYEQAIKERDNWRDSDQASLELAGRYRTRALAAEAEVERLRLEVAGLKRALYGEADR